jgi:hypothetical protein
MSGPAPSAENLLNKMTIYKVPSQYSGPFQGAYNDVAANNNASTPTWKGAAATSFNPNANGTWDGSPYGTFVGTRFANAPLGQQETILVHEMAHPFLAPDESNVVDTSRKYNPGAGGIPKSCGTQPLPPLH